MALPFRPLVNCYSLPRLVGIIVYGTLLLEGENYESSLTHLGIQDVEKIHKKETDKSNAAPTAKRIYIVIQGLKYM